MYKQLHEYLNESGLLNGLQIQYLIWRDKGNDKTYLVFRPSGGSVLSQDLGNEHLVLVDFIAPSNNPEAIDDLVHSIANYITNNSFDKCLGLVRVVGNIPSPVTTTDERVVYRLMVSIKHGN